MPKYSVTIKTQFGEVAVEGDFPEDLLKGLDALTEEYVAAVNDRVSVLVAKQSQDHLKGIVEARHDGSLITYRGDLSHYAAIGLVLYSMRDYQASSRDIKASLSMSGVKVMVPARLHEMVKRGHLFKPMERGSFYKLTVKGVKWVEDEVLPPLREKLAAA